MVCGCEHCSGQIEFEEAQARAIVQCPHCGNETVLRLPPVTIPPPLKNDFSNLTIGNIAIAGDKVITPNGTGSLAESQWLFSDVSRTESRIPPVAIILAIVFALLCLIGLLFLLMKETTTSGYAEVSVHAGKLYHKVQIPVKSKQDVDRVRELVNKAQSLAMQARFQK